MATGVLADQFHKFRFNKFWLNLLLLIIGLVSFLTRAWSYKLLIALFHVTDVQMMIKATLNPALIEGTNLEGLWNSAPTLLVPILTLLVKYGGLTATQVTFLVLFLINVGTVFLIYHLSVAIYRQSLAGLLAALFLMFGQFRRLGLSFNAELGSFVESHYIGLSLGLIVLLLLYRERVRSACLVAGLMLVIHPSHAVIIWVMLTIYLLLRWPVLQLKGIAQAALIYLLAALPFLWRFSIHSTINLVTPSQIPLDEWWRHLQLYVPHHMAPATWGRIIISYTIFFVIAVLAYINNENFQNDRQRAASIKLTRLSDWPNRHAVTLSLFGSVLLTCTIALIGTELVIPLVIQLTLFRSSVYVIVLGVIFICAYLARLLVHFTWFDQAIALLLGAFLVNIPPNQPWLFLLWLGLLVGSYIYLWRPLTLPRPTAHRWLVPLILAGLVLAAAHAARETTQVFIVQPGGPREEAEAWLDVQLWSKVHTPPDANFLTPSYPCGFSAYSDRRIVFSACEGAVSVYDLSIFYKETKLARDYGYDYRSSEYVVGQTEQGQIITQMLQTYRAFTAADFYRLATKYGATYAVIAQPSLVALPRCYANDRYGVYALGPEGCLEYSFADLDWQFTAATSVQEGPQGGLLIRTDNSPNNHQIAARIPVAGARDVYIPFSLQLIEGGLSVGLVDDAGHWLAQKQFAQADFYEDNLRADVQDNDALTIVIANQNPASEHSEFILADMQVYFPADLTLAANEMAIPELIKNGKLVRRYSLEALDWQPVLVDSIHKEPAGGFLIQTDNSTYNYQIVAGIPVAGVTDIYIPFSLQLIEGGVSIGIVGDADHNYWLTLKNFTQAGIYEDDLHAYIEGNEALTIVMANYNPAGGQSTFKVSDLEIYFPANEPN